MNTNTHNYTNIKAGNAMQNGLTVNLARGRGHGDGANYLNGNIGAGNNVHKFN